MTHGVILTTLDLYNDFLKMPLTAEAKKKTAFVTEQTTSKFKRIPRLRNTDLDDIILPSRSWGDTMVVLSKVLEGFSLANLILKPLKCTFEASYLDYLGFRIFKGVIRPGRKVEAVANFPQPTNVHALRRFLGLSGYLRRFIVNYAYNWHLSPSLLKNLNGSCGRQTSRMRSKHSVRN